MTAPDGYRGGPADAPGPNQPLTDLDHFGDVGAYRIPDTGPYVAASFDPKRELRLVRNPRFKPFAPHAQPHGYPDQIVIRILGDGNSQEQKSAVGEVEAGKSDWTSALSPEEVERLAVRNAAQLHTTPEGAVQHLMLNTRQRPFSDVRARRALAYAIDRNRLAMLAGGSSWHDRPAKSCRQPFPDIVPTAPTRSTRWQGSGVPPTSYARGAWQSVRTPLEST